MELERFRLNSFSLRFNGLGLESHFQTNTEVFEYIRSGPSIRNGCLGGLLACWIEIQDVCMFVVCLETWVTVGIGFHGL